MRHSAPPRRRRPGRAGGLAGRSEPGEGQFAAGRRRARPRSAQRRHPVDGHPHLRAPRRAPSADLAGPSVPGERARPGRRPSARPYGAQVVRPGRSPFISRLQRGCAPSPRRPGPRGRTGRPAPLGADRHPEHPRHPGRRRPACRPGRCRRPTRRTAFAVSSGPRAPCRLGEHRVGRVQVDAVGGRRRRSVPACTAAVTSCRRGPDVTAPCGVGRGQRPAARPSRRPSRTRSAAARPGDPAVPGEPGLHRSTMPSARWTCRASPAATARVEHARCSRLIPTWTSGIELRAAARRRGRRDRSRPDRASASWRSTEAHDDIRRPPPRSSTPIERMSED